MLKNIDLPLSLALYCSFSLCPQKPELGSGLLNVAVDNPDFAHRKVNDLGMLGAGQ